MPLNVIRWIIAAIAALWIPLPATMALLIFVMALDFGTGLLAGRNEGKLSSAVGAKGLRKKASVLLLIIAVHEAAGAALPNSYHVGTLISGAYIINELISITENVHRTGADVPPFLMQLLEKAKRAANWTPEDGERRAACDMRYDGPERRTCAKQETCPKYNGQLSQE